MLSFIGKSQLGEILPFSRESVNKAENRILKKMHVKYMHMEMLRALFYNAKEGTR